MRCSFDQFTVATARVLRIPRCVALLYVTSFAHFGVFFVVVASLFSTPRYYGTVIDYAHYDLYCPALCGAGGCHLGAFVLLPSHAPIRCRTRTFVVYRAAVTVMVPHAARRCVRSSRCCPLLHQIDRLICLRTYRLRYVTCVTPRHTRCPSFCTLPLRVLRSVAVLYRARVAVADRLNRLRVCTAFVTFAIVCSAFVIVHAFVRFTAARSVLHFRRVLRCHYRTAHRLRCTPALHRCRWLCRTLRSLPFVPHVTLPLRSAIYVCTVTRHRCVYVAHTLHHVTHRVCYVRCRCRSFACLYRYAHVADRSPFRYLRYALLPAFTTFDRYVTYTDRCRCVTRVQPLRSALLRCLVVGACRVAARCTLRFVAFVVVCSLHTFTFAYCVVRRVSLITRCRALRCRTFVALRHRCVGLQIVPVRTFAFRLLRTAFCFTHTLRCVCRSPDCYCAQFFCALPRVAAFTIVTAYSRVRLLDRLPRLRARSLPFVAVRYAPAFTLYRTLPFVTGAFAAVYTHTAFCPCSCRSARHSYACVAIEHTRTPLR